MRKHQVDRESYLAGFMQGQKSARRWTKCTEKLPEDRQGVITFSQKTGKFNMLVYGAKEFLSFTADKTRFHRDVTHWMPLPEPPEKNNE